jgi:S-adenosylmethionine-diacylglycerol 3-amino-3-carboxypropyl transferase
MCWEDADVLLDGLDIQPGDDCLAIASAGDNALAMLTRRPGRVVAIDRSAAQLACLALRVAAYRRLSHGELLELVGSKESARRRALYARCRPVLSDAARRFWDRRPGLVEAGIGAAGRFERYFRVFRRAVLPLCHSRRRVAALLQKKSPAARRAFYERVWNNRRWRLLMRAFCSEWVLGFGRDRRFFEQVDGPVARPLLRRFRRALTALDPSENPYLEWILTGRHRRTRPLALREEHFETIRAHLDRLSWRRASLAGVLRDQPDGSFDRFNLSDVFEYVAPPRYRALLGELARVGRPGGRLAYWNLFVDRQRPPELAGRLRSCSDEARRLHERDKALFYKRFVLEEVR